MKEKKNLAMALSAMLTGCGVGSASVEGDVGGLTIEPSTVFAWVDKTYYQPPEMEGQQLALKNRDDQTLHIRVSGASFDPSSDFRFFDDSERARIELEEKVHGRFEIEVGKYQTVSAGQTVESPAPEESATDASIDIDDWSFARTELEADAEYPGTLQGVGSVSKERLTLDEVGSEPGESVSGTLEVVFEKRDTDPSGVRVGTISIEFSAEVLHERLAECNFGSGTACDGID